MNLSSHRRSDSGEPQYALVSFDSNDADDVPQTRSRRCKPPASLRAVCSSSAFWQAAGLAFALFVERFAFIVTVYKTEFHGYVLILAVCFLNALFALALSLLKRSRHKKRLYEQFNLERAPHIGCCVIMIVAAVDMFYVFFLFWPANVIPVSFLVTLLQLFIPLNMLLRRWCMRQRHFRMHLAAGFLIFAGCVLVFVRMDYGD